MNLIDKLRGKKQPPPERAPASREVERARGKMAELELRLAAATIDENGGGNARKHR